MIAGYTINQKRLEQLQKAIQLVSKTGNSAIALSEMKGLLEIIDNYARSFVLLNQFDGNKFTTDKLSSDVTYEIQYAVTAIAALKKQLISKQEAGNLFGNQKDDSFAGILGSIVQTFDGEYLYGSIE